MNVRKTSPTMIWYAPRWLALVEERRSKSSRLWWYFAGFALSTVAIALVRVWSR
jgi:hypothetical protein